MGKPGSCPAAMVLKLHQVAVVGCCWWCLCVFVRARAPVCVCVCVYVLFLAAKSFIYSCLETNSIYSERSDIGGEILKHARVL